MVKKARNQSEDKYKRRKKRTINVDVKNLCENVQESRVEVEVKKKKEKAKKEERIDCELNTYETHWLNVEV